MNGPWTPRIVPLGDAALRIVLGDPADEETGRRVAEAAWRLAPLPVEIVPGTTTLTLHLQGAADPPSTDRILALLTSSAAPLPRGDRAAPVEVSVRYGGADGPDLEPLAAALGLSPDELVRRHAGGSYLVRFLGFLPGFAYLDGLDPALAAPRRAEPRTRVPAGSVAIGGRHTGIYPVDAPGGWWLIGRTRLSLFDAGRSPPARLRPGAEVRFQLIEGP